MTECLYLHIDISLFQNNNITTGSLLERFCSVSASNDRAKSPESVTFASFLQKLQSYFTSSYFTSHKLQSYFISRDYDKSIYCPSEYPTPRLSSISSRRQKVRDDNNQANNICRFEEAIILNKTDEGETAMDTESVDKHR